jgi:two-component system, OmpR family, sensor histidine kinase VanS
VDRAPGLSVRLKLTLSYAGFLMLAGAVLLVVGYFSLSRGVHPGVIFMVRSHADLWRAFAPTAAIVMAFLLVFGLLGGWLLAGRMLAPLTRITDATRVAAGGSLSHRIELEGRQDEFRELADAFDTMLARLDDHVAEQRRFAANASHELRTPLAITQTLLDVARNDPDRDTDELVDRLHAVNSRSIELTEALLLLSRADQRSFAQEEVDLSLVAEEAAEALLPLAEKRGLTIETSGEITPTVGSHALLLQMTTNLVHNAIVHNLPEHGTVRVTTGVHAGSAVLAVENTGERLTTESVATLAEPFRRGTERIRADHAGVGLGLAIVKSITRAHDGTLTLVPRPDGGLRVSVQLPAAPLRTPRRRVDDRRDALAPEPEPGVRDRDERTSVGVAPGTGAEARLHLLRRDVLVADTLDVGPAEPGTRAVANGEPALGRPVDEVRGRG